MSRIKLDPDQPLIPTLVVDDEDAIRHTVARTLAAQGHACVQAAGANEARVALQAQHFDLVLCDVNMPGESGLDLVKHVLKTYQDTAVVMITGVDNPAIARIALEAGAYGYVVKPFTSNELAINAANALLRRRLEIESHAQRGDLVRAVRERTENLWNAVRRLETSDATLRSSIEETVLRLSLASELHDEQTARHVERMSRYSELLARKAGMENEQCQEILLASRLHDAGKLGVPDRVLRKRGNYTTDEFETMKQHAEAGHSLFAGSSAKLLVLAGLIAWTHHEWYDGSGYPRGLRGEEIPIEGRIAAVADVFDALISKRPYKPAFPIGKVVEDMRAQRGTHFDPALLDSFLGSLDEVMAIASEFPN